MKVMVQQWLKDVSFNRNSLADQQLINFYNWLGNKESFLYEPALFRTLHTLMKKLFLQVRLQLFLVLIYIEIIIL